MFPLIGASEPVSSGRPADIYTCGHRVASVRSDICVQLLPDRSHGNTARTMVPNCGALRLLRTRLIFRTLFQLQI